MSALSIILFLIILSVLVGLMCFIAPRALITQRKRFLGLSCLLLIGITAVLFWGIFHAIPGPELSQPSQFRTEDGLAIISAPEFGWQELPPVRDASLTIGNHATEEYLAIIAQPKSDFGTGFTIHNFAAAANRALAKGLDDAADSELSDFKINGLKATRNQISGKFGTANTEYMNTYIEGERHFYQVRTWTSHSKRGVAFPKLKTATASFRELAGKSER